MAFTLTATVGDTVTQLNDGSPFRLESVEGLMGSDVVRHEQRAPLLNGALDVGYRLAPRVITLSMIFYAATDALLDEYRQQLMAAFKPLSNINTLLTATRDDGEVRTLSCYAVGSIDIALVPELRPGHMHRATVRLRGSNPLWQATTTISGSATFTGMGEWWLAGGAITSGSVANTYEYPAQAQVTAFMGTITGNWAVAIVTAQEGTANSPGTALYAWQDSGSASFWRSGNGTAYNIHDTGFGMTPPAWPGGTAYNYHVVESRAGTQYWRYWNGSALVAYANTVDGGTATYDIPLVGAGFYWRRPAAAAGNWTPEIRKAVILRDTTTTQLHTLGPYMLNSLQGSVTLVNDGDVKAYPLITLRGPLADPIIVNQTAGGTLDLTGGTLAITDTWTIDLRNGDKRIFDQNGVNKLGIMSNPVTLANFYLAPAPTVTGGTNVLVMTPGSVGSAAYFGVEITNQYMSY